MQFRFAIFMAISILPLGCNQKAPEVESLSRNSQPLTLKEYLQDTNNKSPSAGAMGVETEWMPVSTLKLTSGRLWIVDPDFVWAEANDGSGCVIDPEPSGDGRLVYMQSGFGDCGGPVLRLLSDDQPVGLEFEFINADEPRR